jgi:GDP-L-fucose synthase
MKVLVTGGHGMLGCHIQDKIWTTSHEGIFVSSKDYDLTSQFQVRKMFEEIMPDAVIHAAAKVGGIQENINNPIEFLEQNILMNTNVVREAYRYGVRKLIGISSTCVYPDTLPEDYYPLEENSLHIGPPTPTNFGYAMAKRVMGTQIELYRERYDIDYSTIYACNLYSQYDNFDNENKSHFVTALIKKIQNCVKNDEAVLKLFGTGKPLRQFIHASDLADIIVQGLDRILKTDFNVAGDECHSIREMAEIALNVLDKNLILNFDTLMPDGQFRKDASNKKMKELFPDFEFKPFANGIESVYNTIINE